MIFELPDCSTVDIAKQLTRIRESGTQATTGRVLTLIVVANETDDIPALLANVTAASREHPSRVLVLVADRSEAVVCAHSIELPAAGEEPETHALGLNQASRLDAEIRIGGDAGAAEIIVMHLQGPVATHMEQVVTPLLLPDTPIVAWWPSHAPVSPAEHPIGKLAQRRIIDSRFDDLPDSIYTRRDHYTPGDSDMCWARITPWRGVVATTLDQPPHRAVIDATLQGPKTSSNVDLAAGWLADRLGANIVRGCTSDPQVPLDAAGRPEQAVQHLEITRQGEENGVPVTDTIVLNVLDANTIEVLVAGKPPAKVAIASRTRSDCLAEELRHLDPDVAYARALRGLERVRNTSCFEQKES